MSAGGTALLGENPSSRGLGADTDVIQVAPVPLDAAQNSPTSTLNTEPGLTSSSSSSTSTLNAETAVTIHEELQHKKDADVAHADVEHAPHSHDHDCGHVHFSQRAPWLRAALLGAQDGLISVASLMVGVGAVNSDKNSMIVSGLAGLVAGACSMAIGEYVSVYSQRDIEEADIRKERMEFEKGPEAVERELEELTMIYVSRGLNYDLAKQVAKELSAVDPVRAHARDELGIDMDDMSNPMQAALASAVCFVSGAIVPLLAAAFIQTYWIRILVVLLVSTLMFIAFGMFGAWMGGARKFRAAVRTTVGGLLAIGITYGILRAFGTSGAI